MLIRRECRQMDVQLASVNTLIYIQANQYINCVLTHLWTVLKFCKHTHPVCLISICCEKAGTLRRALLYGKQPPESTRLHTDFSASITMNDSDILWIEKLSHHDHEVLIFNNKIWIQTEEWHSWDKSIIPYFFHQRPTHFSCSRSYACSSV